MRNRFWPVVCAVCDKEDEPCYALFCRSFQKPLEEVDLDWENWGSHLSSPTFLINFSAPHLGLQMEWISSTLSENNHTFLVCCGLWHEKPTFVASYGLMCPQNHRCGLVVASRACFPRKKSHPDPKTTRNFRHFRQGFILTLRSLRSLVLTLRSLQSLPPFSAPPPPPPFDPSPSKASKASKPPSLKGPRMQPREAPPSQAPFKPLLKLNLRILESRVLEEGLKALLKSP